MEEEQRRTAQSLVPSGFRAACTPNLRAVWLATMASIGFGSAEHVDDVWRVRNGKQNHVLLSGCLSDRGRAGSLFSGTTRRLLEFSYNIILAPCPGQSSEPHNRRRQMGAKSFSATGDLPEHVPPVRREPCGRPFRRCGGHGHSGGRRFALSHPERDPWDERQSSTGFEELEACHRPLRRRPARNCHCRAPRCAPPRVRFSQKLVHQVLQHRDPARER